MNKTCIVLSGVSGSGKSTLAESLKQISEDCVICCADDYFYKDGEYKFDAGKLHIAHLECKEKFKEAVANDISLVIVANTNTQGKHANPYLNYARDNGYEAHCLIVCPTHSESNCHNVPIKTMYGQANQVENMLSQRNKQLIINSKEND